MDTARVVRGAAGTAGATAAAGLGLLAAQVWTASRRKYLSPATAPAVEGEYGDLGAPPLRLVMIGDSTGAGIGVTRTEDTVGGTLARRLARDKRRVRLSGVAIAGSGSGDLGPQISRALLGRPDVAVVLVGAMDATRGTPVGAVRRQLSDAVHRLRAADVKVIVGTCPDLGACHVFAQPLRGLVAWRGRRVATASSLSATAAGGVAVDLATETGAVFRADPGTFSVDQFHPSADGYRLIAEALMPAVSEAAATRASL